MSVLDNIELGESGNKHFVISWSVKIGKNHLISYFDLNRLVFMVPESSPKSSILRM